MRFSKYSQEDFIEAVKNSTSIRQILKKLGVKPCGGNYKTVHRGVKYLNLSTSHFLGQAHSRGKKVGCKRPIEDYLSGKVNISSYHLKTRLLSEGYFEHKCYNCNRTEWNEKPIPIELEHIDGNYDNNQLDNLTILCPNCHAQTDTYRGKNIKKNKNSAKKFGYKFKLPKKQKLCKDCDTNISSKSIRCKSCASKFKQKDKCKRPTKENLEKKLIEFNNNKCALGRFYGVSDNAVRKWIKYYNL